LNTENLSTLKIHKLTQAQYDRELEEGRIDEAALYLTPEEDIDLSGYATEIYVDNAISAIPTPDVSGQVNAALEIAKSYTDSEITEWVGDKKVSEQISTAITPLTSEIANKANSSHGNHVPTTEVANNARFLRNDNTWQAVAPENIGASASGHKHTKSEITDIKTENWTFTLEDGSTVTKAVYVG